MADKDELDLHKDNPGRAWYVIHTYSGYENKVKTNLERLIHTANMENMIFNVVVPVEKVVSEKDGKERDSKIFPGYVLVEMIVDERSWYVVRNTTGVTGFVGSEKHPIPLTEEEANRILNASCHERKVKLTVKVGDKVVIKDGPFESYAGMVKEIDEEKSRIKVLVDNTPVDLDFSQVAEV